MDHRPFEEWLLGEQPLNEEQKRHLQEHLRTCADCAALYDVHHALRAASVAAPAAGFASRFRKRLRQRRTAQRRRAALGVLLLALGVLGPIFWSLAPYLKMLLHSPADLLATWLRYLVFLFSLAQVIGHAGMILLRVLPDIIPLGSSLIALSAAIGLILLWLFSLWKLAQSPRGI